jgi:hypothetical protein
VYFAEASIVKGKAQILSLECSNLGWEDRKNINRVNVVATHRKDFRLSCVGHEAIRLFEDIKDGSDYP